MSSPRYGWWSYVKDMIRRYPERLTREADLSTVERCEFQAVRQAVSVTELYGNGRERLLVVELVYWRRSHTLQGAALAAQCSERTAKRYHQAFIREVAQHFQCNTLMEEKLASQSHRVMGQ